MSHFQQPALCRRARQRNFYQFTRVNCYQSNNQTQQQQTRDTHTGIPVQHTRKYPPFDFWGCHLTSAHYLLLNGSPIRRTARPLNVKYSQRISRILCNTQNHNFFPLSYCNLHIKSYFFIFSPFLQLSFLPVGQLQFLPVHSV